MRTPALAIASLALLPGCATVSVPSSLAGTHWRLVAIEPADAAQGATVRPEDPSRYTLRFGADGVAAFQLDCNRATAGWQVAPAAGDQPAGRLVFAPIMATRAMCAPPAIDQRVIQALPSVGGYRFRDGRLQFVLVGGAEVVSWERTR